MATPRPTKKPSASPLPEDDSKKSLDSDDKAFIQKLVADSHQDIYFQGWVDLYYNDKDPKKRILVITNFRVITIKVNVLGRSVRQQFPLLDLTKLQVKKENFNQITLEFGTTSPAALINYEKSVIGIAQVILFAYQAITFGRPPDLLPKVDLPLEFLSSYLPPEPDAQDGLLATYLAECDYNKLEQRIPVLDYLMTCFQLDDRVLDLGECLAFIDKENKTDVHALASALKYSKWFTEITAVNFPLKNEGLQSISALLTVPSAITKLVLVNIKAGRFAALSKAISQGTHSLNFLNLSKNPIGDQGLKLLMDGLQESKKVLHTLCLRNCGFTNKGLKSLFTVLSQPYWLAGLKILDISDNPLGKSGTQDMCQWLSLAANAIEQLYIVNVDLVPEILFPTLEANKPLITTHLVSLNISGNKLSKKAVPDLCKVLTKTGSLSQLYLSNAGVTRTSFVQIIDFCLQNTTRGLGFSLDFSSNHLGVKGVKDLDTLFMDWLKKDNKKLTESGKLHTLVLSDNDLGTEGIQLVCKALKSTSIHTLSLDRNMKVGMFNSGKEAGEALASLINDTPHLKELTVAGSDSLYMKGALLPLLAALGTNGSLRHLDISKNKLGDQGIIKLAEALATNSSLTTFNAEGNKINVRGLQALHEATSKNKTLIDWVIPMEDVQKLVRAPGDKKTTDMVLKIVHELELNMERNQKALRSSEVKVGGMTSQELESILGQRGIPSMRMSTVGDDGYLGETQSSKHRKTHSRLLDLMQQSEGRGGGGGGGGVIHTPISSGPSTPVRPKPAPPAGTSPVAEAGARAPAVPASILKTVKPMNVGPIGSPRSMRSMSPTPRPPTTPTAASPSSPATPTPPPAAVHTSPTPTPPPTAAPSPSATSAAGEEWKTKHYPFEKLESNVTAEHLPPGVRSDIRELYLDNDKFHDLFELTKEEYLKLPKWKQSQLKKKNGLF